MRESINIPVPATEGATAPRMELEISKKIKEILKRLHEEVRMANVISNILRVTVVHSSTNLLSKQQNS
jgi:hypothetical protein